ncbi:hypothetical protein CANARDRAFT_26264 [[Candida] arabinofermentans NRRL YB-2248]|uniref:J domain-containing protein n=1 Tax=[Candida] arabinofermentans NRRL YB-2248 TaxID=983967 RepID=A0A1E4T8W6_9ASCO|nr:hypothetical protein CANARDRAFT_26264 [[Candida] arabinofermentans NRRL YB-2248]
MLRRYQSSSSSSSSTWNYFKLFPKTFPNGGPPSSSFDVSSRDLKKEFKMLQGRYHPDLKSSINNNVVFNDIDDFTSVEINAAYKTLSDPLTRSQYILKQNAGIDLNDDSVNKKFQFKDQSLLMDILDIHEDLENIQTEEDLEKMNTVNDERIYSCLERLKTLYENESYEDAALETVKMKYWYNIRNALKEWEQGKPVNLTH